MSTLPLHTLATVEEDAAERCRFVCACGKRGRFVRTVGETLSADDWARGAHAWHVAMANDPNRPDDWGTL